MDKKTAQNLIEDTFNESFYEEKFIRFSQELLNDIDFSHGRNWSTLIYEDFADKISKYKRVGLYNDPEGNELEVLIVEVENLQMLEKARTTLRNFVIKWLQSDKNKSKSRDYGLVAFYAKDDKTDWRFSFIKVEQTSFMDEEKGKVKTKKEFTPAKRYSFLVGKYEKAHTAKNQLLPLLQNIANNPTIEELEAAFSIEKVTDEFFQQYKDLYIKLFEYFEKDRNVKAAIDKAQIDNTRFTKKLLGQIVFLYFLQKKGWLGVAKNERWGTGKKRFVQELNEQAQAECMNFFKDKLQYLFYEALAKERDNVNSYYERFDCRIPFLNGGLFEADYDWRNANITIPETLFRNEEKNKSGDIGTGVLDVFDRYNFTIKEDEPMDKEVAVDPEMLGKVFENMLDITERKSKGAFYTPREIVHYMCQESLIHYLDNSLNSGTSSFQELGSDQAKLFGGSTDKKGNLKIELEHTDNIRVPKKDIETYIREGHFALENDERVAAKGETKTYKYQLPESIRQNADLIDQKLSDIRICDPAIGSGAFPVGLLHELVNAMLVLKPHFSYDYLTKKLKDFSIEHRESVSESRYIYRLKRHIIQESIYGVDIDASAIDIARLRLWLSLVVDEDDLDPIETLPNLDYKIVCGNSLIGLPDGAMRNLQVEAELETLKEKFYDITDEIQKKALRQEINTKIRELLDSAEQFAGYKIDFDFKLFFSEVWREKGGFDVVIGNPPYNEIRDLNENEQNDLKKSQFFNYAKGGRINLFQFFYPLGIFLARRSGGISFITQNSILAEDSAINNRKLIFSDCTIIKIDSFPERDNVAKRVFESAKMSVGILFLKKYKADPKQNFVVKVHKDRFLNNFHELLISPSKILKIFSDSLVIPISNQESLEILLRLKSLNSKWYLNASSGEIDMTKYRLRFKSSGDYRVITGAQVQQYFISDNPSQGEISFLNHTDLDTLSTNKLEAIQIKKIVLQRITGVDSKKRIIASILPGGYLCANSTNVILEKNCKLSIETTLAILNSELINFFFKQTSTNTNVTTSELNNIPFPLIEHQLDSVIATMAKYLIELSNKKDSQIVYSYFDNLTHSIVCELYFPEEIKSAGKEILKHLGDLKPITDEMSEEKKLAIIKSEFERLYDPNHPVRFAIETLDSVEEVRIIKEALK